MITKAQFDFLSDENITKKQYDEIINLIDVRFTEICKKFLKIDKHRGWFDYGNCSYGNDGDKGHFDPKEFAEYIYIGGECISFPEGYDGFPTRWLWEDFEDELKQNIENFKKEAEDKKKKIKEQKEAKKKQLQTLKTSIKSKLTDEEWKIVKSSF